MYRCALSLLSFLAVMPLPAQSVPDFNTPAVAPAPPPALENQGPALPVQKVGPDDLLSISVANSPELTRNFRVSADGTLALPMLQRRLNVAGKDTPQIEKDIADELVTEQILVQPVVTVSVVEFRSRPVSVMGAVRHPITFQATGNVTLLDALTRADGLSDTAGSDILISHSHYAGDPSTTGLTERIPVHRLINEADPSVNLRLNGGEQIRVPFAGRVYVMGNVKKSGAYSIQDNDRLTVMKVLAESEGLAPYAQNDAYIFRKEAGRADRNEITVPIHDIMNRKAPDVGLQANDILYIPDNRTKRVTEQTILKVLSFGAGTVSGYLIFH
jgi:polysaccharide biosynthesis/export protein